MSIYIKMSPKRVNKCCVSGCEDITSTRHRFPTVNLENDDVFNVWLERMNNPKLKTLNKEKIYKNYYVCDRHFSEEDRIPNSNKLKKRVIPSLFLSTGKKDICLYVICIIYILFL